jgi:hypothetical protein
MRLEVFERKFVTVKREAIKRIDRCRQEGLCRACLEPVLPGEKTIRDIHLRCYHATFRAVRAGKTTWADRLAEGKIGEVGPVGRKPTNAVSAEFA